MRDKLWKKLVSLTLAFALVLGMMPAIPGAVDVAHADTIIKSISVTGVTAPVVGKNPSYTASVPDDAAYSIETEDINSLYHDKNGITWVKLENNTSVEIAQDETFIEGNTYEVRMEINADTGYTFDEKTNLNSNSNVTINGQSASVISWLNQGEKVYIKCTFPPLEAPETITSIKFSHETDIKDHQAVGEVKVSEINGIPYEGPEVIAYVSWYRSTDDFNSISAQGVQSWNGTAFDGGYAYGLRIEMPDLNGYVYPQSFVVSLKTPSTVYHSEQLDANRVCYFYWSKLAHIPQLDTVNLEMDGFYVGENITKLTFTSDEEIALDGGYGSSKRYTIKQLNANQDYEVLSTTTFQANKNYYLCYYLESALDLEGLDRTNVKLNGNAAIEKDKENGRTYYLFSLGSLSETQIKKTPVTSIVVSLPKDKPVAGDDLYYPTVVSVNGNTNLSDVVNVDNVKWYQNDFHVPEEVDYAPADSRFVQGKSYILWMSLTLAEEYKMADTYTLTVQTPSGNLEGILDSDGESYVTYEYYFNLGAPTELPIMSSYAVGLSGYQVGKEMEATTIELKCNGISVPKEVLKYGQFYVFADQNQKPVTGTFAYDTQYYMGVLVVPYNCKIDGLNEAQIKSMVTLRGMHPETVTVVKIGEKIFGWEAYFKLPILRNTEALKSSSVTLSGTSYTYSGKAITPTVTVKNANGTKLTKGTDYTVAYKNNVNAGTATVTVKGTGKYTGTITKNFTIKKASLSGIKISGKTATYNGSAHTVTVSVPSGAKVTYKTSSGGTYSTTKPTRTSAGTTTVYYKVTKANYNDVTGSVKIVVNKKSISSAALSYTKTTYSGSAKKPTVTVKNSSGTKLTKDTHYTVTYASGRTKVGTYKVTIKGKGNYTGTITKTFKINPKKAAILKLVAGKKAITVKWKKVSKQATGYEVMYSTSKTFKKGSATKTKIVKSYTKTSLKLTKLKGKKRYYVRVRTYKTVNGKKHYSGWSVAKKIKTK